MKNKILFLIIGMFLLIGIGSVSATWSPNVTINYTGTIAGDNPDPNAFQIGNDWYLLINQMGFVWNGTGWADNTTINNSDSPFDPADVFFKDDSYYLISGITNTYPSGFKWNGTGWQKDLTINASLPALTGAYSPNAFQIGNDWYMFMGTGHLGESQSLRGFAWDGSQWLPNSTINTSLEVFGTYANPSVFTSGSTIYMLVGAPNGTSGWGSYRGKKWDGSQWLNDTSINASLPSLYSSDLTPDLSLSVFYKDSKWFMLGGISSTTRLFGFVSDLIGAPPLPPTNFLISKIYPSNNLRITTISNYFNVSLSTTGTTTDNEWINNTYYIWFSNGTTFNKTTVLGLSTNSTIVNKTFNIGLGNYLWNSYACYGNSTFDNCIWASGNFSFYMNSTINSNTANALGYETGTENYVLNISSPTGYTPSSAYLVYNGTSYSATITSGTGYYLLSKTLQIPSSQIGANTFYYKWNLSSTFQENSTVYNQTVSPIQFGLCNGTLTVPYLNITFKDETTELWMNATIPTSTFLYYLGDGSITKTLTYSQTVNQSNYKFCALPSNQTYHINPYLQYKMGTDYPQRIYDPDLGSYTNSTTNVTLYLLSSTDGIYVTFQVVNSADQVLNGVSVVGTRDVGGVPTIVANGITGSDGSVVFWLNPDYSQNFTFSKSGYVTYTTLLTPTQSSYTITLSGSSSQISDDYTRGIKTYLYPKNKELDNDTSYNFIFNVTSSYWELDNFGFNLRLANETIVGTGISTVEGTGASLNYNVNNQTIIYMDYYWTINGNQTTGSTYWVVSNTLNTGWSIKTFFTDLALYLDSGIFGLDNFGRYLIAFLVLFISVGIMGYKFGMTSPIFISATTFAIVIFLDVITGLIPSIRGINHLATYVAGLILVLVAIGEGSR